jgi:hypothetical protein
MSATKFHTHTKQQQNYSSVYLNLYIFGYQTGRQNILRQMTAMRQMTASIATNDSKHCAK